MTTRPRLIAPLLFTAFLSAPVITSCSSDSPAEEEKKEDVVVPKDTKAPVITTLKKEADVSGGKAVEVGKDRLLVGAEAVASWSDDS